MSAPNELLTQAGLAKRWGVSRQAVNQAIKAGRLPPPVGTLDGRPVWSADTQQPGHLTRLSIWLNAEAAAVLKAHASEVGSITEAVNQAAALLRFVRQTRAEGHRLCIRKGGQCYDLEWLW